MNHLIPSLRQRTPVFQMWLIAMLVLIAVLAAASPATAAGPWYVAPNRDGDGKSCLTAETSCAPLNGVATTFTVNSLIDAIDANPGNGVCAISTGECTLRAAVMEANALSGDDTIALPAGIYTLTLTGRGEDGAATGDLDITSNLTITGAGAANTIVDAGGLDRVFHVFGSYTVNISTVTIRGGNVFIDPGFPGGDGGGIFNSIGLLTLTDSIISGNSANNTGSGIFNSSSGILVLNNSSVFSNSAPFDGSSIFNDAGSTTTIANTTVNGNNYGIANSGVMTIADSIISNNYGLFGGVFNTTGGVMNITTSTINGNTAGSGGGGIINGGTLTLVNSAVISNTTNSSGGGISSAGILTATDTTIIGNSATSYGGGIYNTGALTLNDSQIISNTAPNMGGVDNQGDFTLNRGIIISNTGGIGNFGFTVLDESVIRGNSSYGIYNSGNMTITHSAVSANESGIINFSGGGKLRFNNGSVYDNLGTGISNQGGIVTTTNSTISGNRTSGNGGGIENIGTKFEGVGTVNLNNVTLTNNVADADGNGSGDGGGVYNLQSGWLNLQNTLIAGNTDKGGQAPDCSGTVTSEGYNLLQTTTGCTITGTVTGNLTGISPNLGPLQDNGGPTVTRALFSNSPAINAGNPSGCADDLGNPLAADQRGQFRIGRCDIGAYEYFATKQVVGSFKPGGVVTYTILLSNLGGLTPLNNVTLTDTLPNLLIYLPASLTTTTGTSDESGGVITWTGNILTDTETVLMFAATISATTSLGTVITNTAIIQQGNVTVTAPVAFQLTTQIFLPLVRKDPPPNYVWYVTPNGNDANNCISPATACASINSVLSKPGFQPGNSIRVAAGTYTGTGLQVAYVNKSASISGGWDAVFTTQNGMTIIDGQNARRGVLVEFGATVTLDRFILQNGRVVAPFPYGNGGGLLNYGVLTVTNSAILNNFVSGVYFGEGGGIYNGGVLTITNSTISGNTSQGTSSSNRGRGGGILNYYGALTLNNVTISNNTGDEGGGLQTYSAITTTVRNSIIAGNTSTTFFPDCYGSVLSLGYNLFGTGCASPTTGDLSGTPGAPLNANIGPLQDNGGNTFTHVLLVGSPAIDAANPAAPGSGGLACAVTDQRGVARPQGAHCDMGAYEYSP